MIDEERIGEIRFWYNRETDDEETQEWREDLTEEEERLVEEWDKKFQSGIRKVCEDMLDLFFENRTRYTKKELIGALKKASISTKSIGNACMLQNEVLIEFTNGTVVKLDQYLDLIEIYE